MHPESGKTVSTLGGRGNTSFAANTAEVAGMTKQAINMHVARAEAAQSGGGLPNWISSLIGCNPRLKRDLARLKGELCVRFAVFVGCLKNKH